MLHKAFEFDFKSFDKELRPILVDAIFNDNCDNLAEFIRVNKNSISDPYEGSALNEAWETMIEPKDAHQYGDFALTRYYSPKKDIGLGSSWESVQQIIVDKCEMSVSPILGVIVGPANDPFDPGKMGSYFQDIGLAKSSLKHLKALEKIHQTRELRCAIELLKTIVKVGKGLYVTF